MPFGLKNVRATYQRLVDSAFQTQLDQNLEAYVDDMVIKSKTEQEMIMDITKTFKNLRKVNMKLNSKKCSFGIKEGKFIGYMVTSEWIRANPKKTKEVVDMESPKILKEMQSLSEKLAALNQFLSRCAKRALPFFETLKNITNENKDDYYAGGHIIRLPRHILGRDTQQARSLGEISQILSRAQSLQHHVCSLKRHKGAEWTLYTDRASSLKGVGAGLVPIDPTRTKYTYAIRLNFSSTNNEADYEALLAGLWIAKKMKVRALKVKVDSKLVAYQLNGDFVASSERMTMCNLCPFVF
ncbi:reverse transcriptase domain-containing protein [Tanacetum coccineum]